MLAVLMTNMILYTGFGEFCLFVWGNELEGKPLITMNLPKGPIVYAIKILYSVNIVISIALQAYPANVILESYVFKSLKKGPLRKWLINLERTAIIALSIISCILLGDSLDKFNSLSGTLTATPVAFTVPCLMHYFLCDPTPKQKAFDIFFVVLSIGILLFCSGFTIWTWNE